MSTLATAKYAFINIMDEDGGYRECAFFMDLINALWWDLKSRNDIIDLVYIGVFNLDMEDSITKRFFLTDEIYEEDGVNYMNLLSYVDYLYRNKEISITKQFFIDNWYYEACMFQEFWEIDKDIWKILFKINFFDKLV